MKKLLITLGLAGMTVSGADAHIVINEIRRQDNFGSTEYMEFLITEDISQAVLNSYIFGDTTSTTNAKFSGYQFNVTGFTTIRAGTIISVGGSTVIPSDDNTYSPVTGGGTNDQWNLAFNLTSLSLIILNSGGDFTASDVAWIDTSATGTTSIHSINWDPIPGTFGATATVTTSAPTNPGNISYLSGSLSSASNYAVDTSSTLGIPNGGLNDTYVTSLRAVPEPGTWLLSGLGSAVILVRRRSKKA